MFDDPLLQRLSDLSLGLVAALAVAFVVFALGGALSGG